MIDVGRLTQSRLPPRQPRPGHCHATSISGAPQGSRYDWTEILRHQLPSGDGTVALLGRSYYTSRTQRSRLTKFDNHGVGSSLTTTLKNRIRGIQHGWHPDRHGNNERHPNAVNVSTCTRTTSRSCSHPLAAAQPPLQDRALG
ncbi:hypothetical protein BV22DRAFT_932109 [Leucogyrophana mollusca]|uniref:Uncharacterized protein n=1 Tax=Leucogyrophana mollusca TaxID=85980 RepID=A0ACB8AWN4_9AGAM|nr:hypothetical protein BV22DRAFT_932109 [Leucogyrophana mollusca]